MDSAICLFNVIERASVHSVYMFNVGAYMAEKISVSKCAGINNIENKIIAQRNENNSKITHSWCICIGYRGVLVDRFCMQSMDCFLDAYFFQRMCDIQPEQAFYIFVWLRSLTVYWFVFVSLASCFLTLFLHSSVSIEFIVSYVRMFVPNCNLMLSTREKNGSNRVANDYDNFLVAPIGACSTNFRYVYSITHIYIQMDSTGHHGSAPLLAP